MSDNIKGNRFASFRIPAWHKLGTVFDHEVTDYREMLTLSGADFTVEEFEAVPPAGYRFAVPTKYVGAQIGADNVILGTAGSRYHIVQNDEAFAFLQSLNDGARWETAGVIKDGRVVFGSVAFEREIVLDPSGVADKTNLYLLIRVHHDGTGGVEGGRTAVRAVCKNTLDMAFGQIDQTFKFRHTLKVAERMELGAEEWRNNHLYFDELEAEMKTLFEKPVTDKQYFEVVQNDLILPKPADDASKIATTKWENKFELFTSMWQRDDNAGIRNTAWGAVNALTEANQWGRNAQKDDKGTENFFAAGAGFDGPTKAFRQTALELVKAL